MLRSKQYKLCQPSMHVHSMHVHKSWCVTSADCDIHCCPANQQGSEVPRLPTLPSETAAASNTTAIQSAAHTSHTTSTFDSSCMHQCHELAAASTDRHRVEAPAAMPDNRNITKYPCSCTRHNCNAWRGCLLRPTNHPPTGSSRQLPCQGTSGLQAQQAAAVIPLN